MKHRQTASPLQQFVLEVVTKQPAPARERYLPEPSPSLEAPSVLRERVTSKGGTTEAALASLAASGVSEAIVRAVQAAEARGRELGEQLGKD